MLLVGFYDIECAFCRGVGRQLDTRHEVALVLFRHESGGQLAKREEEDRDQAYEHQHHPATTGQQPDHTGLVALGHMRETTIEPAREPAFLMVSGIDWLEQGRAQRRGQRQGKECREQDRHRHRQRKLPIDHANRAACQSHRNEHRRQNQRNANHSAADLFHRLGRCLLGWQSFLGHDAFDVLNDHDGVVDDDADRQDHAKHRQHVDGEAYRQHDREGA